MSLYSDFVPEKLQVLLKNIRRLILQWSVQRPILSILLVIASCVLLLPIITAVALTPLAMFINYSGLLASQGILYITYNVLTQGLFLGMIIVALFIAAFAIATSASVLHSYKILQPSFFNVKRKQT